MICTFKKSAIVSRLHGCHRQRASAAQSRRFQIGGTDIPQLDRSQIDAKSLDVPAMPVERGMQPALGDQPGYWALTRRQCRDLRRGHLPSLARIWRYSASASRSRFHSLSLNSTAGNSRLWIATARAFVCARLAAHIRLDIEECFFIDLISRIGGADQALKSGVIAASGLAVAEYLAGERVSLRCAGLVDSFCARGRQHIDRLGGSGCGPTVVGLGRRCLKA